MEKHTIFMDWNTQSSTYMSVLSKLMYRFNTVPVKIIGRFFFFGSYR